jgi:hypothetical protein
MKKKNPKNLYVFFLHFLHNQRKTTLTFLIFFLSAECGGENGAGDKARQATGTH